MKIEITYNSLSQYRPVVCFIDGKPVEEADNYAVTNMYAAFRAVSKHLAQKKK